VKIRADIDRQTDSSHPHMLSYREDKIRHRQTDKQIAPLSPSPTPAIAAAIFLYVGGGCEMDILANCHLFLSLHTHSALLKSDTGPLSKYFYECLKIVVSNR
jgi:hypothetical protein